MNHVDNLDERVLPLALFEKMIDSFWVLHVGMPVDDRYVNPFLPKLPREMKAYTKTPDKNDFRTILWY